MKVDGRFLSDDQDGFLSMLPLIGIGDLGDPLRCFRREPVKENDDSTFFFNDLR